MTPLPLPWRSGACLLVVLYLLNTMQYGFDLLEWPRCGVVWWLGCWGVWLAGSLVIRSRIMASRRRHAEILGFFRQIERLIAENEELKASLERCADDATQKALDRPPVL